MTIKKATILFISCYIEICYPENSLDTLDDLSNETSSIELDEHKQKISGIKTIEAKSATYKSEQLVFGKAINPQSLFELHFRYQDATTEHHKANSLYKQSELNSNRQTELYQFGITSKHKLEEQQTRRDYDSATLSTNNLKSQAIANEAKLNWGEVIYKWIISSDTTHLNGLIKNRQTLLRITLPDGNEPAQNILVSANGIRESASNAELISLAPWSENTSQGISYFYITNNTAIKPNMNVTGWLPEKKSQEGVIIPRTALIWESGQAFLYVKGEDTFIKTSINNPIPIKEGYFIKNKALTNQTIVTTGNNLLLSKERIKHEDDND